MSSVVIGGHRPAISTVEIISLAGVTASIFVALTGIPFTIPQIVRQFDVGNSVAGLAATLEVGGIALACLLYAPFVPKFQARVVCSISLAVLIALNIASILAPSADVLLVCRACAGIVAGLVNVTTSSIAGRVAHPEKIFGVLLGSLGAIAIGLSVLLPQAKNFGPTLGLTTLDAIFAIYIVCLAIGLLCCWRLPTLPVLDKNNTDAAVRLPSLSAVSLRVWALLPGLGFVSFGVAALMTFLVSLGTEQVGLSVESVGFVMMAGAVIRIGGPIAGSYAGSHFRAILIAAVVLTTDAVVGMLLAHSTTQLAFSVLAPILSSSTAIFFPVLLGTLARTEPTGRFTGMHTVFAMGGTSAGSFVGGVVSGTGDYTMNGYVVAGGMIVAALLLFPGLKLADRERFGELDFGASRAET